MMDYEHVRLDDNVIYFISMSALKSFFFKDSEGGKCDRSLKQARFKKK